MVEKTGGSPGVAQSKDRYQTQAHQAEGKLSKESTGRGHL